MVDTLILMIRLILDAAIVVGIGVCMALIIHVIMLVHQAIDDVR